MTEGKATDTHRLTPERAGLCASCRNARLTGNRRGSVFLLCGLWKRASGFRKYPPLPVLECPGYESTGEFVIGGEA